MLILAKNRVLRISEDAVVGLQQPLLLLQEQLYLVMVTHLYPSAMSV